MTNLYRQPVDLAAPLSGESSALEIQIKRFSQYSCFAGMVLTLPESDRERSLHKIAQLTGIETCFYDDSKIIEKPLGLKQQRWNLEDDSGCDDLAGIMLAEVAEKHKWSELVLVALENLLVDPAAVEESLKLYFQEGFEICFSAERQTGANWIVLSAEVLRALCKNHEDLMQARGGLAWALRKPLYPFNLGYYHCPRIRPKIFGDLRLNSKRNQLVFNKTFNLSKFESGFSYGEWLNDSGWEKTYTDFQPLQLHIEPSAVCQARCHGCPHNSLQRKQGLMTLQTFKNITSGLSAIEETRIVFSGLGEPLLNPALSEMIRLVEKSSTMLVTSLQRLPADDFYFAGLDQLRISVDALEAKGFEENRPGCNWKNIETFIAEAGARKIDAPDSFPELGVSLVRHEQTESAVLPFLRYWKKVVMPIYSDLFFKWPFDLPADKMQWFQVLGENTFLGQIEKSGTIDFTPVKRRPCRHALLTATVFWDGSVSLCPFDTEGKMVVGNINDDSLINIWRSENARAFRAAHLSRDFAAASEFCAGCRDWYHNL